MRSFGTSLALLKKCPRQDSNLRTRLRRPLLYPLSYGGAVAVWQRREHYQLGGGVPHQGLRVEGKRVQAGGRAPTLEGVPGASGRVLVVDDSQIIRQLIKVILELDGFEVMTLINCRMTWLSSTTSTRPQAPGTPSCLGRRPLTCTRFPPTRKPWCGTPPPSW